MRNLYLLTAMLMISCSSIFAQQCIKNGNFELGPSRMNDFTYTMTNGENGDTFNIADCTVDTSLDFNQFMPTTTINATNATLVQNGNDPDVNLPMVHNGNFAMKLNDRDGHSEIATMSQTFTAQTETISFFFSLIVQNGHPGNPNQQPFFSVRVYDTATGEIINNNDICIVADSLNPIFDVTPNGILFTGWRCGIISIPEEYINESVRLEFIIADCGQGGHWGTVYIDDITCDLTCEHPAFGYLDLDPVQYQCPTEPITVCGSYIPPSESVSPLVEGEIQNVSLDIVQGGNVIQTIDNATITENEFCFTVNPQDFGLNPEGNFELNVTADFTFSNGFTLTLFDSSSVSGADVTFVTIDPYESTVSGNILEWEDVAESYEIEFVSDNTCCPGGAQMQGSYSATLTTNQIDLTDVQNNLQSKCFRWRIRAEGCASWSEWCCLTYDNLNQFPDANFGNVLEEVCYPESTTYCVPTLHATFTETGFLYEQRQQWITAVNTIEGNANVEYQAGEYVELQPGFNTVTGSIFLAHIDDCVIPTFALKNLTSDHSTENQNSGMSERFEIQNHNKYNVYPNPSKGNITVQFEGTVSSFTVHDVTGKQLITVQGNSNGEVQLDLSNLAKGVYMLSADGMPVEKIIKN